MQKQIKKPTRTYTKAKASRAKKKSRSTKSRLLFSRRAWSLISVGGVALIVAAVGLFSVFSPPHARAAAAKFVPPDGQTYIGMSGDWDTQLGPFSQAAGIDQPAIFNRYTSLDGTMQRTIDVVSAKPGITPMVSWSIDFRNDRITNGSRDAYLAREAGIAKAYGKPLFVRPNWEMNGTWYPEWDTTAVTPQQYIDSFRYIVKFFDAQGVTNVAWVWSVNDGRPNPAQTPISAFYPGDDVVDWMGMDSYPDYKNPPSKTPTMPDGLNDFANYAKSKGKPAMLSEWGRGKNPDNPDTTTAVDIVFEWAARYPDTVKALIYFDHVNDNNHELELYPVAAAAFRKYVVGNPRYITKLVTAAPQGLTGNYYSGPNFSGVSTVRLDPAVNFAWGREAPMPGVPADGFSVRWTGQVTPPVDGTYTFTATTDDGVRLWVNDKLLVDNWVGQSATARSGTIALTANKKASVRMEYYDGALSASASLAWAYPGMPAHIIPETALNPVRTAGLNASYFSYKTLGTNTLVMGRVDPVLNFAWGNGGPGGGVANDKFAAHWSGKVTPTANGTYTFTTRSDDGVRLWVNGKQLVNNWTNHGPTDNSGSLALVAGRPYDIKMEYYEAAGGATAQLSWSGPGLAKAIIPASVLRAD